MTNKLVAAGCLMAFTTTPIFADEAIHTQDTATTSAITSTFSEIDTNHDMKINLEELKIKDGNIAKFKKADADNDGSLNEAEFVSYNEEK